MNQKQAKRLRRMEKDICTLHNAHYSTMVHMARLEEQLYHKPNPKPPPWRRILQAVLHKGGG